MSSKAAKISLKAKQHEFIEMRTLSTTLVGSICSTLSILTENSWKTAWEWFMALRKDVNLPNTVKEIIDYIIRKFKLDIPERFKKSIILIYDSRELKSPLVTLLVEETALPLNPEGIQFGLINDYNSKKENAVKEFVYDS